MQVLCKARGIDRQMYVILSGSISVAPSDVSAPTDILGEGCSTCVLSLLAGRPNASSLSGGPSGACVVCVPPHALHGLSVRQCHAFAQDLSGAAASPLLLPPPPPQRSRKKSGRAEHLVRPFIGFALSSVQAGRQGRIAGLQLLLGRCARRREFENFSAWSGQLRKQMRVRCFADNLIARRAALAMSGWLHRTWENRRKAHMLAEERLRAEIEALREGAHLEAQNLRDALGVARRETHESMGRESDAEAEAESLRGAVLGLVAECEVGDCDCDGEWDCD